MFLNTSLSTINTAALTHNFQHIRRLAPRAKILAMLKANAYGHGAVAIAKSLPDADAFGVACLAEALQLRYAGITHPIVVMRGILNVEELAIARRYRLDLVVHQHEQITLLEQQTSKLPLKIWLKINTNMNRLGFMPEEVSQAYQRLMALPIVKKPLVLMTHFACADEPELPITAEQIKLFQQVTAHLDGEKSLANSAGILRFPEAHADWVRPGLMLYGVSPFAGRTGVAEGLQPVMTWRAQLIAIRQQCVGDAIGYGATWQCPEKMPVGIVSIGYADGYPRHAESGTPLLAGQQQVPLIGRVSMDMLAVDLRPCLQAKVGDEIILWGDGLPIENVALHTGTTAYELLCHVKLRGN